MAARRTRASDRDSAGRLLRVLGDCELYHMEAAIASLERVKSGIRSESLLKPSDGDDVDVLECIAEGRVVSLSDHKRIARLQAALTTVANAYNGGKEAGEAQEINSRRNLVCAVAGAAVMQATRDCTASRTNCCIWGPQAEKLHFLLDWMVTRECANESLTRSSQDYVRQLLLEWIQPTADKQSQLGACLALFELLQRRRQRPANSAPTSAISCLLGDRVGSYLDALRAAVDGGMLQVPDSNRVKPSKLGLIALETLVLLCGDIAAEYATSNAEAKKSLGSDELMNRMVENARYVIVVLRRWHLHSTRRQFLGYALQHLQSYGEVCKTLLLSLNGFKGGTVTDPTSSAVAGLDALSWHWCATAPLLCTRCNVSLQVKKSKPHEVLARVLQKWTEDILNGYARQSTIANPDTIYAQCRYACVLIDLCGGMKGCSKAFEGYPANVKMNFIFFFVHGLSVANKSGDVAALHLTLSILRAVLLPSDPLHLLSSRDEEQNLLSQLLREIGNGHLLSEASDYGSQARTELELLVADFIISRRLFISDLVTCLQDFQSQSTQNVISFTRMFLHQLDHEITQEPIYRLWRQQLSPSVVPLLGHGSCRVRRLALSCLPSLDDAFCIAGLCAGGVRQTDNYSITSALGYLFNTSTQYSREVMTTWFVDACRFGSPVVRLTSEKCPLSPHDLHNYTAGLRGNSKKVTPDDEGRKEKNERLLSLCFGPNGWNKSVRSTNARSHILGVVIRKLFGSPRDTVLLRILREFVGSGWFNSVVFETSGKQLTTHMMNLERLSEDSLNDNSAAAAKTIEGLLFSRLAPLLVLRMLPRGIFGATSAQPLQCGCEDLSHLNEYISRQQHLDDSESEHTDPIDKILFHVLACSVVDPLEFKEVKMLATEALTKFPPPTVLPFVFAYLLAFLRETGSHCEQNRSLIVNDESIPSECGLVTAKLMVYYLNRLLAEDEHAYKDSCVTTRTLVVLIQIMGIPCNQDSNSGVDVSLLADLQRGCIDCIGLILSRLASAENPGETPKLLPTSASSLMNLLLTWIFEGNTSGKVTEVYEARVQELFESVRPDSQIDELPLQTRICCCNILLSTISRLKSSVLERWKSQGFISRVALATESCAEEAVVAGGLQIIFSFLYKASELIAMENSNDLQLVRNCFETTVSRLESTRNESVAMSGLKVVGALVGKLPSFVSTLPQVDVQRLIDGCLVSLRDRQLSPAVSELAQSLLQAMAPP